LLDPLHEGRAVNDPIRVNHVISRSASWLVVGTSVVSTVIGSVLLAQGADTVAVLARAVVHCTSEPATINLIVAICALIAALLAAWRKPWRSAMTLLILIAVIAVSGMFSSLLFRDDYTGGSCGEFEWPAGHLHAGYPYSWLDGEICVPPHIPISEYASQHPEQAGWHPDLPALLVDLLFWMNIGILVSSFLGSAAKARRRVRGLAPEKKTA
jgi:lysylphosphatidylglycerol synthetase-like protein (DUF2156 family)